MTTDDALAEVNELAEHARAIGDEHGVEFFGILADALQEKHAKEPDTGVRQRRYCNGTVFHRTENICDYCYLKLRRIRAIKAIGRVIREEKLTPYEIDLVLNCIDDKELREKLAAFFEGD